MAKETSTVTSISIAREASRVDLAEALKAYTWATIEAKNLLHCISIAADHAECVDEDIRPAIGIAIDGVARLFRHVSREFEHLDAEVSSD